MRAACLLKVGHLQRSPPSALLMLLSTGHRCHTCFGPFSSSSTGEHKVLSLGRSGTVTAAGRHSAVAAFPASQTSASTVLTASSAGAELKLDTRAAPEAFQSSQSADGFLASPATSFTSLGLSHTVAEALHAAGFARPASVQVRLTLACRSLHMFEEYAHKQQASVIWSHAHRLYLICPTAFGGKHFASLKNRGHWMVR